MGSSLSTSPFCSLEADVVATPPDCTICDNTRESRVQTEGAQDSGASEDAHHLAALTFTLLVPLSFRGSVTCSHTSN